MKPLNEGLTACPQASTMFLSELPVSVQGNNLLVSNHISSQISGVPLIVPTSNLTSRMLQCPARRPTRCSKTTVRIYNRSYCLTVARLLLDIFFSLLLLLLLDQNSRVTIDCRPQYNLEPETCRAQAHQRPIGICHDRRLIDRVTRDSPISASQDSRIPRLYPSMPHHAGSRGPSLQNYIPPARCALRTEIPTTQALAAPNSRSASYQASNFVRGADPRQMPTGWCSRPRRVRHRRKCRMADAGMDSGNAGPCQHQRAAGK